MSSLRDYPSPNYDRALVPEVLKLLKIVKVALKTKSINNREINKKLGLQMMVVYNVLKELKITDETN